MSYEVDFTDFPMKDEFYQDASDTARQRDRETFQALLANVERTNPEPARRVRNQRDTARQETTRRSAEDRASLALPVVSGQRIAVHVPTANEIKKQLESNPELSATKKGDKFDVVEIQNLVWESVPLDIQNKYQTKERFADGILGQDTANAIKQYIAQNNANNNSDSQAA